MKDKKQLAITEVRDLKRKLHLYNDNNRYYVEKRIKELVEKHKITYGDMWNEK